MSVVRIESANSPVELDVCSACYLIWFDPSEFESMPASDTVSLMPKNAAPASQLTLAKAELKLLQEEGKAEIFCGSSPDHWWEVVLAVCGLPVEYDKQGVTERPVLTWSLSAVMVLLAFVPINYRQVVIEGWGLLPSAPFRNYGLTFVSSFFLHAGLLHLLGNLYFFLVFGDNVEQDLGRTKYVLLLAASALLGSCFHIIGDPRADMPLIGASGGISGIIVYYALQFPKTRIGILLLFRWYRIPVGVMLFFWILWQLLGVVMELSGVSNVSALGHLGGAAAGFVFWLVSRQQRTARERGSMERIT